jgi:uncharacterized membrane protein
MSEMQNAELKISKFLRFGVFFSGAVIALGWIMSFKMNVNPFENLQHYKALTLVQSIKVDLLLGRWGHIVSYVGLACLISLPVLRVFLATILFVIQKERIMAAIGILVLVGLILSFSLGIEH